MYRHADSICWLNSSRKKIKTRVIGLEFIDIECKQIKPKKPATKDTTKGNGISIQQKNPVQRYF